MRRMAPTISVVMPVYNERATIEAILNRVEASGLADEIILVDDGSRDGTRELLAELAPRHSHAAPAAA